MSDFDRRREEIEKRLQAIREEREQSQLDSETVTSLSLTPEGPAIACGCSVKIRPEAALLESAERGLPNRDTLKSIYLGERGVVKRLFTNYLQRGPAVEVSFVDGIAKTFFLSCLDLGSNAATTSGSLISRAAPQTSSGLETAAGHPSSSSSAIVSQQDSVSVSGPPIIAAPSWTSLRRPGVKLPQTKCSAVAVHDEQPAPRAPSPIQSAETQSLLAAQLEPQRRDDPADVVVSVKPLATPVSIYHLTTTPRGPLEYDDDDLRAPLRAEDLRPSSEGRDEELGFTVNDVVPSATDAGSARVAPSADSQKQSTPFQSKIPACPPDYAPCFPLGDPISKIPRAPRGLQSSTVKHCTVVGLSDGKVQHNLSSLKSMSRPIAFRSHHSTMDAILAACTKELDWGRLGRRVERLFLSDGTEVLWPDAVPQGALLVGTSGESFRPQLGSSVQSAKPSNASGGMRAVSPVAVRRPVLPSTTSASQKPISVKVFVNGEYGDVKSDPLPFQTVTIRPTFKTLASVCTLLGRELHWSTIGRRVEVLYTANGEEITSLESLRDGDAIVASSGDRFIVPRPTSVLHAEFVNKPHHEDPAAFNSRPKSPVSRPRSPMRSSAAGNQVPVSDAQARAARLLVQMQSLERQQLRRR